MIVSPTGLHRTDLNPYIIHSEKLEFPGREFIYKAGIQLPKSITQFWLLYYWIFSWIINRWENL